MQSLQTITLGGGCFWCTEAVFVLVKGIVDVESGYCNGQTVQPSYEQVCSGRSGHAEVVQLVYDPQQISLRDILAIFFLIHDPTTLNAQGHDTGTQYRSGIYFDTAEQQQTAQAFLAELTHSGAYQRALVTEVLARSNYSAAEDYHQDYFEKHPHQGYCLAVAAPKVAKLRQTFARFVREP